MDLSGVVKPFTMKGMLRNAPNVVRQCLVTHIRGEVNEERGDHPMLSFFYFYDSLGRISGVRND